MQRHLTPSTLLLSALAIPAMLASGAAAAGEPLPERPGFGYTMQFAAVPVAAPRAGMVRAPLIERPGFGYTITFLPGDPADSLYPPGWVRDRLASQQPGD